jgi:hypothetical protein
LAVTIAIQVIIRNDSLILHIALLSLFLNSVYYIATNYRIVPFWDGNWDFAVVTTFNEEGRIFQIPHTNPPVNFGNYPAEILSIYSGWPMLHIISLTLSQVSGINLYLLTLILPLVIGFTSFLFVYLLMRKIGASLRINTQFISFAMLLYVTSAEALFYPMQFVHQNLGLTFFYAVIFTFYLSRSGNINSRKYCILVLFFAIALVISHHFTSVIMVLFFLFLFIIQKVQRRLPEISIKEISLKIHFPTIPTLMLVLISSVSMFLWWETFAPMYIWRKLSAFLLRFFNLIVGAQSISYMPPSAYYPEILRPFYATFLLNIRDILIYIPAVFGLLILLFKRNIFNDRHSIGFIITSFIAFGLIFILNYLFFRVEIFRILLFTLPLIILLTIICFYQLVKKRESIIRILAVGVISIILVLAAFIGLWGHRFAPSHVYNPEIKFLDAGERYTDAIRTSYFFNQKIRTDYFQTIWVDDSASIVSLLKPKDYLKVMVLSDEYVTVRLTERPPSNELICEFHNLNLYRYFTGGATSTTPETGKLLEQRLNDFLKNNPLSIRIFDDDKYRFWIYKGL